MFQESTFPTIACRAQLYVWESQMEVVARHLLLLQVAQDWELPIRQKANVFLEIFGNCLVQVRVFAIGRLRTDISVR